VPATTTVFLIICMLAVLGVVLIAAALAGKRRNVCPGRDCRHANPPGARYCARCGAELPATRDSTDRL